MNTSFIHRKSPILKLFQRFVINRVLASSERLLHEGSPLEVTRTQTPPPTPRLSPLSSRLSLCFLLPPLSALLFNSRSRCCTPEAVAQFTSFLDALHVPVPGAQDGGRLDPPAPRTCVSVRASCMDGGWMEWVDRLSNRRASRMGRGGRAASPEQEDTALQDGLPAVSGNSFGMFTSHAHPQWL